MKKCPCCNRLLPIAEFSEDKTRKDGLKTYCKECRRKKNKEYRQTDDYRLAQEKYHRSDKCKEQSKKYYKTFRVKHLKTLEGKKRLKNYSLKSRYGITASEHLNMWEMQNGCCAICGKPVLYEDIHTDHNHFSGKVRGLVCQQCNHGLGLFYVDEKSTSILEQAIVYLLTNDSPNLTQER